MPKPARVVVNVPQSDEDDLQLRNLKPGVDGFRTGGIGGCAFAVILWNPLIYPAGSFLNGRAQHGAGGPKAIVWEKLMDGASKTPYQYKFRLIVAKADASSYFRKVADEMQINSSVRHIGLFGINMHAVGGFDNPNDVIVWRDGSITPYEAAKNAFDVDLRSTD